MRYVHSIPHYAATGLYVREMKGLERTYESIEDMVYQALYKHRVHAGKPSMQSSIGALSRLCRTKVDLIVPYLGRYTAAVVSSGLIPTVQFTGCYTQTTDSAVVYGNPCLRAVNKMTSRPMGISVKTKSIDTIVSISPLLKLLTGLGQGVAILRVNGTFCPVIWGMNTGTLPRDVSRSPGLHAPCSIDVLIRVPVEYRRLICSWGLEMIQQ